MQCSSGLVGQAEAQGSTTAKRCMDDELLCYRFLKRLRLTDNVDDAAAVGVIVASPYEEVNGMLHELHEEQQARRMSYAAAVVMDDGPSSVASESLGSTATSSMVGVTTEQEEAIIADAVADAGGMTCFCILDVVQCEHGAGGRCLRCMGRLVQNVPLPVYTAFCGFYSAFPAAWGAPHIAAAAAGPHQRCTTSSSSTARHPPSASPAWQAVELTFPAFVALAGSLAPEPGERLLHLGSGMGRAVVAWSLLFPQSASSGIEGCASLHHAAAGVVTRLSLELQGRIHLHHCDPFGAQCDWQQASVILVSAAGFDEAAMARVVEGLQGTEPGTRVVTLSRPLCLAHGGRGPAGFQLARQAAYRTTSSRNTTVFIYRKAN